MFQRVLITGIVLFWLAMTGLLLRLELFPGKGNLLPVPIEHIVGLFFLHQQPSDLVIYHRSQRLGTVHVQPQRVKDPAGPADGFLDILGITGATAVKLPGVPNGRATFRSSFELGAAHQLRQFEVAVTFHASKQTDQNTPLQFTSLQFDGRPPLDHYHYVVRRGDEILKEAAGTMDSLLADPDLNVFGFDPRAIVGQATAAARGPAAAGKMVFSARRGDLHFNGEDLETFVVTARYADSLESTVNISQLGQLLVLKTFLDYDFYDEALSP